MSLTEQINQDIKSAMLARESRKLEALRAIKAALLLAMTEKKSGGEVSETVEMQILQKLVKQRKESSAVYRSQNRPDLAEEEEFQAEIIEKYLPEQISPEKLREIVGEIIRETGASGIRDMGRVMGAASKKLAGKADNKVISEIVKELLS